MFHFNRQQKIIAVIGHDALHGGGGINELHLRISRNLKPGTVGLVDKTPFDAGERIIHADARAAFLRHIHLQWHLVFQLDVVPGLPYNYPKPEYDYTSNFLHMMFSNPYEDYELKPEVVKALDLIFLLHADHEQNCSTSTVRMVASSEANLFASAAAGVCALWGPLHGGANQAVITMLQEIHDSGDDGQRFIEAAKDKHSGKRLMGFGHRVYKNYDPRAKIIKEACDNLLHTLHREDPLLDIAKKLEQAALHDSYFVERKLYPNVDFYSGIIMRAIGIPTEMFTVMFAIGRMPGWIANFKEILDEPRKRICRPRQVYVGPINGHYVPIEQRQ